MRLLRSILIPAAIGMSLLAALGMLASVAFLYRECAAVHPVLGAAVLVIAGAGVVLLVVYPLVRIARLPRPLRRPESRDGEDWSRYVVRYARRLQKNQALQAYAQRERFDEALAAMTTSKDPEISAQARLEAEAESAVGHLDAQARTLICQHAAAVFAATAISQSGRLDTAIVVSAQLRLVREVAELYFQRPHPRELWDIYLNVGSSAFLAGEIQDSEMLAVLSAPISAGLSGLIPIRGTEPLVNMLTTSLLDGSANALLTLRVGALARRYCGMSLAVDRRTISRSASLEAAGLLSGVVAAGAHRVSDASRRAMVSGALQGTQNAVRGVAGMGSQVVGGLGRLLGKAGSAAMDATRAVTREAMRSVGASPEMDGRATVASTDPSLREGLATADVAGAGGASAQPAAVAAHSGKGGHQAESPMMASVRFWDEVEKIFGNSSL